MELQMERDRKENKLWKRIRKALKFTSETKGVPKNNFGTLDGVLCQ